MGILNYLLKKVIVFLTGVIILSFLASCGIWDPADSRKVSPNSKERVKKTVKNRIRLLREYIRIMFFKCSIFRLQI